MKITRRILPALLAGPVAAGLVTACSPLTVNATNCSHQQCVTTHATVGPAATRRDHHQPSPAATQTAQPASTVTVTATPTPPPAPTATQAAAVTPAQVEQCLAPVTGPAPGPQSMVRLESAQTWGNLDGCLQVPTAQFNQFIAYVVRLVVQSAASGQFTDPQHCRDWEDGTLTPVVQRYQQQ